MSFICQACGDHAKKPHIVPTKLEKVTYLGFQRTHRKRILAMTSHGTEIRAEAKVCDQCYPDIPEPLLVNNGKERTYNYYRKLKEEELEE